MRLTVFFRPFSPWGSEYSASSWSGFLVRRRDELPICAFPVVRSAVAGITRLVFRTNLYPKMNIKYKGIPYVRSVHELGLTDIWSDKARSIELYRVSNNKQKQHLWSNCIKSLPLTEIQNGLILNMLIRMQNISANQVPGAPRGEWYCRSPFLSIPWALIHLAISKIVPNCGTFKKPICATRIEIHVKSPKMVTRFTLLRSVTESYLDTNIWKLSQRPRSHSCKQGNKMKR